MQKWVVGVLNVIVVVLLCSTVYARTYITENLSVSNNVTIGGTLAVISGGNTVDFKIDQYQEARVTTDGLALYLEQTGDQYGGTALILKHRDNYNGAEIKTTSGSVDLTDLIMSTLTHSKNVRIEDRSTHYFFTDPEMQFGRAANKQSGIITDFVVGDQIVGIPAIASGDNGYFRQAGYITAVSAVKYTQWQVAANGSLTLVREDANIAGLDIAMPLTVSGMRSGDTQALAGANVGELWADTNDDNTVKWGV